MKKILLIRFSSIGDIVLTTPVIRSLKKQLNCQLHTLTRKQYTNIYQNNPFVDKVYAFDDNLPEIINRLKNEQYDFVVDLQKNLRSIKVRKALGVASASFPKVNIQKWLLVNFKINRLPKIHVVDRYFKAVEPLQVTNDGKGLEYFIPPEDELNLSSVDEQLTRGYIGFVIGGQHFTKIFPAEKVAEVINKLTIPVVLLGGKEDFDRGEEIIKLAPRKKVINTCGKFNLNQSASLVKQCNVLITNDTGLMHIGAAFNKPVISVWGNTVPAFGMYPYMPETNAKSFISEVNGLKCRPCSKLGYKKCPKKHFNCMINQDATMIATKAESFYKTKDA